MTPQSAGWTYVGFDVHRMRPGEIVAAETGSREVCLVWISGKGKATAAGEDFGVLGERMSPFDGAPHALYVPAGANWSVTAETVATATWRSEASAAAATMQAAAGPAFSWAAS